MRSLLRLLHVYCRMKAALLRYAYQVCIYLVCVKTLLNSVHYYFTYLLFSLECFQLQGWYNEIKIKCRNSETDAGTLATIYLNPQVL